MEIPDGHFYVGLPFYQVEILFERVFRIVLWFKETFSLDLPYDMIYWQKRPCFSIFPPPPKLTQDSREDDFVSFNYPEEKTFSLTFWFYWVTALHFNILCLCQSFACTLSQEEEKEQYYFIGHLMELKNRSVNYLSILNLTLIHGIYFW